MGHYLDDPIDVIAFDRYFRATHEPCRGTTLTSFTQGVRRWKAVYQDGDRAAIAFEGDTKILRTFIASAKEAPLGTPS